MAEKNFKQYFKSNINNINDYPKLYLDYQKTLQKKLYKVNTAHKGSYKLYRKDLYTKKDFNETIQRVLTREFKSLITDEGKNTKFYMTVNAIFYYMFMTYISS